MSKPTLFQIQTSGIKLISLANILLGLICVASIYASHAQETNLPATKTFIDYFLPTPITDSLSKDAWGTPTVGPRDTKNGLEDTPLKQWNYWDGQIIKAKDGKYHMFASRWEQAAGHAGWRGSKAVHAVSDHLTGPYFDQGLCWPDDQGGKGHTVTALVLPDGRYAVIISETRPANVFVSGSLDGPWKNLGPIQVATNEFSTTEHLINVSIMVRADGDFQIVPRSGAILISKSGILGPYVVQGPSIYPKVAGLPQHNLNCLEDPVVWFSGGLYHIVVNNWMDRKAYHLTSVDGIIDWKYQGLAYDPTKDFVRYTDGTVNHWNKLERPGVFVEDGHVRAVTLAVVDVSKEEEKGNDAHGSKVIVIPFDGTALDGGLKNVSGVAPVATAEPITPPEPTTRVPQTSMGVTQLSNEKLDWLLNAKFGMFIHWGLYSGMGRGEWGMQNEGILPAKYRQYAYPESGDAYFDAADYHPEAWAQLAKNAGMKWMCLTTRHHDGFCLFDSPHPNAFTSVQTLHRDLVADYVQACRDAGLKVGIYYSPLSWRYPGYYDVTGTNCAPNKFGYKTDAAHFENARLMKEENYVNVKKLLTGYGKIDYIYWDGGWLAQKGSDADGAYFHEPGKYLDPANRWPIPKEYQDLEAGTGRPLGIMGMVRKYQPDAITNLRYGWMGDIIEEEGPRETTGKIRRGDICDKCLTIQNGGWGYNSNSIANGNILSLDQLVRYLANCVVRNMTFLLNVTPDRHGVIPEVEQKRLKEMGVWMNKMGDAIYGTRGGPWQPVDRQYGYCYKDSTVFVHLLKDYSGNTFTMPPLGKLHVQKAYEVYTGKPLAFDGDRGVTLHDLDRTSSPADSVIAVVYDDEIRHIWAK